MSIDYYEAEDISREVATDIARRIALELRNEMEQQLIALHHEVKSELDQRCTQLNDELVALWLELRRSA